ncbi:MULTISPECIES: ABC transporter ATP-binding protein [Paenibacillus]|uniref:ABC transporter ATP-binding protein n=1 Tax=Paenibacillus agri TaxID=2744309 RepID=A0A850EJ91_9BACL|nr:ABC transporter ATP-binding protein [Paenibacillus agri]NUU59497.1 ABC transporter ATP-binding protein [Paenibacillus agri]
MEYAIEVEGLSKHFGSYAAVDNISFSVPKNKIFGFLGPNGSGKSTTIRMLCGVLLPTAGNLRVLGKDVKTNTDFVRQNLGYMSQKFSLYEDLSVEKNLDFYAGIYGLNKSAREVRKRELLSMAKLEGREKQIAGHLSGGWKQRLALGCAMIHRPQLMILDEPTAGVDPISRREFWGIIRELADQGTSFLITTHYMDEAERCDLIGFIYNGKIIGDVVSPIHLLEQERAKGIEDVFVRYVDRMNKEESSPGIGGYNA